MAATVTGGRRLLGGVAMAACVLSHTAGTRGVFRHLPVRGDTFNFGRLLLKKGPGQIFAEHDDKVFSLLKLADLQSPPAGANLSRPKRLERK